jgi:uncharacterized protein (TIGR02118 family)
MSDPNRRDPSWKLISFIKRQPALSTEEFVAGWRDRHAPLMARQADFWSRVRRYSQNYAVIGSDAPIGAAETYDGVSELWFDGLIELRAAFEEPGFAAVRADARELIDVTGTVSWVAEVVHAKPPVPTKLKLFGAGRVRDGMTRADAQAYWRDRHPHVVATEMPEHWALMKSYDQAHTRDPGPLPLDTLTNVYDICGEVGMDDMEAIQVSYTSDKYLERVRPDELRFASVADSIACATHPSLIYEHAAIGRDSEHRSG